jgi:hypothetical protein
MLIMVIIIIPGIHELDQPPHSVRLEGIHRNDIGI